MFTSISIRLNDSALAKLHRNEPLDLAFIQNQAASLGKEFGAAKVSLFGSYARNEATAEPDVDILIEKGDIRGMQVLDIQKALEEGFGCTVDVVTTAGTSPRLLGKIQRDAVVLYAARPTRFQLNA